MPNSGPIEPTVRKALSVHATALSMLEKVHLLVIKRFNDKFLSFALSVPSDPSLRGPSLQEILAADRTVWQSVHALTKRTAHLSAIIDTHKIMNLRGKLPVHLELAAPGQGVTDDDWVAQFMKARSDLALGDERPFMPAPDRSGFPTVRALDTDEAGDGLKLLLEDQSELRTTSHSLKATFLSFAAKYGLSHQDRLVLEGHAHSGKMADVYGRDAMARPLRMLSEVIEAIRNNAFFPDANRAGRFAAPSLQSSWVRASLERNPESLSKGWAAWVCRRCADRGQVGHIGVWKPDSSCQRVSRGGPYGRFRARRCRG